MRPGPPRGDSLELELAVTDDLAATVAEGLPAVCTASSILAAGDRACRQLVAPHLEAGETVVMSRQDLSLRSPVPVGADAQVTATVALCTPASVTYEILVRHRGTMVARGSVEHRVVEESTLGEEIAARQPTSTG